MGAGGRARQLGLAALLSSSTRAVRFPRRALLLGGYIGGNYLHAPGHEESRCFTSWNWFSSSPARHISQLVKSNGKRLFLVDTLALVRRMEGEGIPSKQAEAITAAITEVLNDSLENVAQSVVSKPEMQKSEMLQETNLSKFKSEVQSSQEHHYSMLQHETEKLRTDIESMRREVRNDVESMRRDLRHEIDKGTAGQRLDLNLERGRIRDELANQNAETSNLTNKLDREIHTLRAQLEAAKYDVIKYCIGTLVSISAVGLATVRILM